MSLVAYARFVDDAPSDDFWRILHRLSDAAYPTLFRAVLDILRSVSGAISRGRVGEALATNSREAMQGELQRAWEELGHQGLLETVAPTLHELALRAAEVTPVVGIEVTFNVQDVEALAAIERYTAQEIQAISETTRDAIQGIVRRAFESGMSLTQQIDEISQLLGLTPTQAERIARYRAGLVAQGMKPTQVSDFVERQARKLKRLRAEAIARTEGIAAASRGQQERWEQAEREGFLNTQAMRRFWIVAGDGRLCAFCRAIPRLNPEGVALNQPFTTPRGNVMHPTAHVQCRCAVSLRTVRE